MKRKTWREKMDTPKLPKLVAIPANMKRAGSGVMLVPSPREIEELIRSVPEGDVVTLTALRETLATRHGADLTCPLTAGLFVRIVAEAAEEAANSDNSVTVPYWRVVKDDGSLNPKLPGGVERQAERLRQEGHRIVSTRNKQPRLAQS